MTTTKHTRRLLATAILLLSLTLAISTTLIHQAKSQQTRNITIYDFSFTPQVLCIEKGETVEWTNNDAVIYTLWFVFAENESTYLLSDPIPPAQSWSHLFLGPARLLYYDFNRLWVTGELRVYTLFGDVDGDGYVGSADAGILNGAYGTWRGDPLYVPEADFDCDGYIGSADAGMLNGNYGKTVP